MNVKEFMETQKNFKQKREPIEFDSLFECLFFCGNTEE